MARTSRPTMPGYGIQPPTPEAGLLPWAFVSERMASARNYWLATASLQGTPQATPVWGIWVEEQFYFSTAQGSRKGRNLAANPQLVLHLESGDEVVILEGLVRQVQPGPWFDHLDQTYFAKYAVHLTQQNPVYQLMVHTALAWREKDFPTSATRWRFDVQE